ncbi:MAG: hypothetical protein ABSE51_09515 [Terracidiphilus sp.]|jgi:hypothetical protein
MKRWLSILLILLFWLGPLAANLPASQESRLPACCRRNGAHHCTGSTSIASGMAVPMDEAASNSTPVIAAPTHCPLFPDYTAIPTKAGHALTASEVGPPVLLEQHHSPATGRAAARLSQIRAHAGRAPPASSLA